MEFTLGKLHVLLFNDPLCKLVFVIPHRHRYHFLRDNSCFRYPKSEISPLNKTRQMSSLIFQFDGVTSHVNHALIEVRESM